MTNIIKIAMIGLDTSHSVEFTRRLQSETCEEHLKIDGMKVISCFKFLTPFTNKKILDKRTEQLESLGVLVTEDFDEALLSCDAIMLEINDPSFHLEYFKKVMSLNKPIFIDKPLASSYEEGKLIYSLAKDNNTKVFSSSSLRYSDNLLKALVEVPNPEQVYLYGPLGNPPVGSGIIWYGVHAFEMLERAIPSKAHSIELIKDNKGVVIFVNYSDSKRAIIELTENTSLYGGTLKNKDKAHSFLVDTSKIYTEQLKVIKDFFTSKGESETLDSSLEIIKLLDASDEALIKNEKIYLSGY